jgi:predicted lipoprotein with Yx(FWY)xxD motif
VGTRGIEPPPTNVWIYNNSEYNADTTEFSMVMVNSGVGPIIDVRNNAAYAPNSTSNGANSNNTPTVLTDSQGAPNVTFSNNSSDAQVKTASSLFATSPPVTAADWKPAAGSYAINSGTAVPVWSDFYRTSRPRNGAMDMGAIEGD